MELSRAEKGGEGIGRGPRRITILPTLASHRDNIPVRAAASPFWREADIRYCGRSAWAHLEATPDSPREIFSGILHFTLF